MHVDTIEFRPYEANGYIVSDEHTHTCFIIDPGFNAPRIKTMLHKKQLSPTFVINTHGHADHIGGNSEFDVPLYIHAADVDFLADPAKNLSAAYGISIISPNAHRLLKDGEKISFASSHIEVIHTPGHTPGSICLKIESMLFTGDTLFRGTIGRTDFPYGDSRRIITSIQKRLLVLDDTLVVYPGHGASSTLGWEKKHNFYLTAQVQ